MIRYIALIFAASGKYEFMNATVCTLAPKLTTVTAYYSNVNSSSRTISTTTHASQSVALDSPAALSAISTLSAAVFLAQGAERSVLGDELYSLKVKGNATEDTLGNIVRTLSSHRRPTFSCSSRKNISGE
jgi:hypothetical protein